MTWEEVSQVSYLLDDYSGAAAAYSLRLLSSTYSGDAINVWNGTSYADIGFDGDELDTTALAAHCGSNDGFIRYWYDQSGNTNTATQGATANMPKIYDGATASVVTENGKPSLNWFSDSVKLDLNVHGITDVSLFEVISTTDDKFILLQNQGVAFSYMAQDSSSASSLINFGTPNLYCNGVLVGATPTRNAVHDSSAIGSQVIRSMVGASTSAWTLSRYSGFSSSEYIGKVQELIVYPSDESTNRTGIEDNINTFYSIY